MVIEGKRRYNVLSKGRFVYFFFVGCFIPKVLVFFPSTFISFMYYSLLGEYLNGSISDQQSHKYLQNYIQSI